MLDLFMEFVCLTASRERGRGALPSAHNEEKEEEPYHGGRKLWELDLLAIEWFKLMQHRPHRLHGFVPIETFVS
jgi:hypothetical protein